MKSSTQPCSGIAHEALPLLRISGASKHYSGTDALDDVDFEVHGGEVHALLGGNGAGKSTLAKLIAGVVPLTSGSLARDGEAKHFRSPADALGAGVTMVYQETSLIPTMTVAQNLQLGREPWIIRPASIDAAARRALQSLGFNIDPQALVEHLSPAQRQMVEIARAVQLNARVIVFDEPTASLSPVECRHFFDLVSRLRERGLGIIFITHALEEALQVSDRITVLRDGKRVKCAPTVEFDRTALIRLMVGREVVNRDHPRAVLSRSTPARGEKMLSVENVSMGTRVKDMSFSLYSGEIVGITGLVGSGRTEIARLVTGALQRNHRYGGIVTLGGKPVRYRTPAQAILDGVVYITEDRKLDGYFETMTADENIYLGLLASRPGRRFLYSRKARKRIADYWIEKLAISAKNRKLKLSGYSGGNQQKIVMAKGLAQKAEVIFFDEPTHGVDVGTVPEIHEIIRTLAREGKAVVVISSCLPEILSISDRILIARDGRIVQEFAAATATEDKIMHAAAH